jgi:predicted acyltransferase
MQDTQIPEQKHTAKSKRLISLDAFRGLTIIGMLLVNNAALDTSTPSHLKHAAWNEGLTFADMVFPWFLFIVGVALPYAYASFFKKERSSWQYLLKTLSRAFVLIVLGCLIDSSIAKTPVIGLDVLQLIGLAFLAGALIYTLPQAWRLSIAALLLIAHWALIVYGSAPAITRGVFTEDHNIITYINQTYLAQYHLKGLLSVIPTTALVLIGTGVGDVLRHDDIDAGDKIKYLSIIGILLAISGWLWNLSLPFNKPLWTASYILFSAGIASIILAVFYWIIDVVGWRSWAFPLKVFGMNAIVAYVAPILVKVFILQEWHIDGTHHQMQQAILEFFTKSEGALIGGWMYTIAYIAFWWVIMFVLYKKNIFIKV